MNVFVGQRTFLPFSSKYSMQAMAAPAQLDVATAGTSFHRAHFSSNKAVNFPSVHRWLAKTSSQQSWTLFWSRRSKLILNDWKSILDPLVIGLTAAGRQVGGLLRLGYAPQVPQESGEIKGVRQCPMSPFALLEAKILSNRISPSVPKGLATHRRSVQIRQRDFPHIFERQRTPVSPSVLRNHSKIARPPRADRSIAPI